MADLDDLEIPEFNSLDVNEGIERLRQIRLARRTPVKTVKTSSKTKRKAVVSKVKKQLKASDIDDILGMIGDD